MTTISVVIPTLKEPDTVARAIASARSTLAPCEVIVADGDSADGTAECARAAGAHVLVAPGSRAEAMNAGAAIAQGEILLFLHADTVLPDGAGGAVRSALEVADGGAFRLRFDTRTGLTGRIAAVVSRLSRTAYGDQAIFVSRAAFSRLGGYQPLPLMEDYELVRRLRREGRFALLPLSVITSARRHRRDGELRTFVRVARIKLLYRAGASAARLVRDYPPQR